MTKLHTRSVLHLVAGAVLLASVTLMTLDRSAGAQGAPLASVDTTAGLQVFNANCLACHQATGDGIAGVFPPLRGHVPEVLAVDEGREYLKAVVLFGLAGRIEVAGRNYDGLMPSWGHLSDVQLAAVLNYVATAWLDGAAPRLGDEAFTPEELLAARSAALDSAGVHRLRVELGIDR